MTCVPSSCRCKYVRHIPALRPRASSIGNQSMGGGGGLLQAVASPATMLAAIPVAIATDSDRSSDGQRNHDDGKWQGEPPGHRRRSQGDWDWDCAGDLTHHESHDLPHRRLSTEDGHVVDVITDRGLGSKEEKLPRWFESRCGAGGG